jgi:hypothetical protein
MVGQPNIPSRNRQAVSESCEWTVLTCIEVVVVALVTMCTFIDNNNGWGE